MKTINYESAICGSVSYEIPFKIKCNVSGVEKIYTSESYINKKIDKFKGLENLLKEYVCKDAKKMLKEGKEVSVISEELKANPHPKRNLKPKAEEVLDLSEGVIPEEEKNEGEVKDPSPEVVEVVEEMPIMKMDKRGMYRDVKGRVIGKDKLNLYRMVAE